MNTAPRTWGPDSDERFKANAFMAVPNRCVAAVLDFVDGDAFAYTVALIFC